MARAAPPADILFYGAERRHGFMSQWYHAPMVDVDGTHYSCCEQYMMAWKARTFHDEETLAEILASPDPRSMKALGRRVRGFDATEWDRVKADIVERGNALKFAQNPELAAQLLATGDAYLAEASPTDAIWGIGTTSADRTKWRGQNLLGLAIMRVRDGLRRR